MKILVTGSSGFIAGFLIPALQAEGHAVRGIDKRDTGRDFGPEYQFVHGNILDEAKVKEAVRDVDAVIHLAAEHQDFGVSKKLYYEVNGDGTEMLLSAAERAGIDCFVFYSSVAVYGARTEPTMEEMSPAPDGDYGASKLVAEEKLRLWTARESRRRGVIVRPTVIFGPRNLANMYRLISAIDRGRFLMVGDGSNIKSVGYVENLVAFTVRLLERMQPGLEIYNYSDPPHMTSRALANGIARELGKRLPGYSLPTWLAFGLGRGLDALSGVTGWNLPITGARMKKFTTPTHHLAPAVEKTGFVRPFSLDEGIRKTVEWYRIHKKSAE